MPNVHLPQLGRTIVCQDGANLYSLLAADGLLDGPCGGAGVCGKCQVVMNEQPVLACHVLVKADTEILLPQAAEVGDIVSDGYQKEFIPSVQPGLGIAVDIGTTTVVAALYDLSSGKELQVLSCLNGQKRFGQDVISRIRHATEEPQGVAQLQAAIVENLQTLCGQLLQRQDMHGGQVTRMVVAGNTTMVHLLAGYNPEPLARPPYSPVFTGPLYLPAAALGLPVLGDIECVPAIAAYVGGDITAGMAACGLAREGPLTLFLDIGTNGELVLIGQGGVFCCSCAAGPALEGMSIGCGMRAAEGAIEAVCLKNNTFVCQTIRGGTPKGICGSGLLSAIAQLRRGGIITASGRFANHPLVQKTAAGKYVMLVETQNITLNQKDIRQVQLAKGAILSGILALLSASGHTPEEVTHVMVAGQFGAHLTAEALVECGILLPQWAQQIHYVGNTSKSGAALFLLSSPETLRGCHIIQEAHYIELSTLEGYETLFVNSLAF